MTRVKNLFSGMWERKVKIFQGVLVAAICLNFLPASLKPTADWSRTSLQSYSDGQMVIVQNGEEIELTRSESGRWLDTDNVVHDTAPVRRFADLISLGRAETGEAIESWIPVVSLPQAEVETEAEVNTDAEDTDKPVVNTTD